MPTSTVIKLAPKLSIAALKTNIDRELTLCYCWRAINYWGSGHLELQIAIESLTLHFHYSKSTAYRILSSGDSIFWDERSISGVNSLQIEIYGVKRSNGYSDTPVVVSSKFRLLI